MAGEAARELVLQGPAEAVAERAWQWQAAGVDPLINYPIGDDDSIQAALRLAVEVVRLLTPSPVRATAPVSEVRP